MFKVCFASPSALDKSVEVFFHPELVEPCIDFAMALHRSSNVPHVITVFRDNTLILSLYYEGKPTEKKS